MDYIREINAFERWCENNRLPIPAQMLWYKLMQRFNRNGWCEWVSVDNLTLMAAMQMSREATFIQVRNELIKAGLIEYQKGKKGSPNRYRMLPFCEKNTFKNEVQSEVQTVVQSVVENEVQTVGETVDIYKHKTKDIKKSIPDGIPEKPPQEYPAGSFEMRCVERLTDALKAQLRGARVPETPAARKKWADEIERMKCLDGRSEEDIWEALEYAVTDPFWQTNIRSTAKFREKFETLILQARQKRGRAGKEAEKAAEADAWEGSRDYYSQYRKGGGSREGAGKRPKNRFHNLEEHGYDYDAMVWGMMGQPSKDEEPESGREKETGV